MAGITKINRRSLLGLPFAGMLAGLLPKREVTGSEWFGHKVVCEMKPQFRYQSKPDYHYVMVTMQKFDHNDVLLSQRQVWSRSVLNQQGMLVCDRDHLRSLGLTEDEILSILPGIEH